VREGQRNKDRPLEEEKKEEEGKRRKRGQHDDGKRGRKRDGPHQQAHPCMEWHCPLIATSLFSLLLH
jgi:hypothetical protein